MSGAFEETLVPSDAVWWKFAQHKQKTCTEFPVAKGYSPCSPFPLCDMPFNDSLFKGSVSVRGYTLTTFPLAAYAHRCASSILAAPFGKLTIRVTTPIRWVMLGRLTSSGERFIEWLVVLDA
jgi:hypothetical protein